MIRRCFVTLLASVLSLAVSPFAIGAEKDARCYELRIYYAAPGKLDALHARFRDHTTKLFERHGMVNVGYWVPQENSENKLIYILSYPDRTARDASWKAFMGDPEWKKAQSESEKEGRLVSKVDSTFLTLSDISPAIQPEKKSPTRTFELRTYTCEPGRLKPLLQRFKDHTISLFSKHGMGHFGYWTPAAGQPNSDDTLIYLLSHESKSAAEASFKAFRDDPAWKSAREASEKSAGGSLTVKDGVKSLFLNPTDYSATQ